MTNTLISAAANLLLFVALPFGLFHWRQEPRPRGVPRSLERAGLAWGTPRITLVCALFGLMLVGAVLVFPPALELFTREGSAQRAFDGLGLSGRSAAMALIYGVIQTGFAEEFLFRGLIAGALARRMSLIKANLLQALIFLVPHFLVVAVMPSLWWMLPLVFLGSLVLGWARIRSGSIVGPWLTHAAVNVAVCLSVAIRSAA